MPVTKRQQQEIRNHFDVVTDEELAALLGVKVKTLQNRPESDLPAFKKLGRRRLFDGESVRAFLRPTR